MVLVILVIVVLVVRVELVVVVLVVMPPVEMEPQALLTQAITQSQTLDLEEVQGHGLHLVELKNLVVMVLTAQLL